MVLVLLDVRQVLVPGLPMTGAFLKAVGKGLKHGVCFSFVPLHLVLQGLSIALKPPCHHRREYGSPRLPWKCQQSRSTAPASPCRRPMQLACPLHSNPSWGSYLVVCGSPSCLPPCSSVVSVLRKIFHFGRVLWSRKRNISLWEDVVFLQ